MNPSHHNYNSKSGFSLIEVLVVIFIILLVGLVIFTSQGDVFSLNKTISDSLTAQDEAREALKSMSAEIRTASPSSLGAYPLVQTATSSFIFYSDIDNDSLKERVRYFVDGTTLKKGVIKPSGSPLAYNQSNETITERIHNIVVGAENTSVFSYYDKNYDGTTPALTEPVDISAVRLVKIAIVIDKNPQAPPSPITLTTQVSMRNLKDNL